MKDLDIAIVLLSRQQDRLSRQIKALFAEDFDYPTLKGWRDGWAELPLLKYPPNYSQPLMCSGHKLEHPSKLALRHS